MHLPRPSASRPFPDRTHSHVNDPIGNPDDLMRSSVPTTQEIESALRVALIEEREILDEVAAMPIEPVDDRESEYLREAREWIESESAMNSSAPSVATASTDSPTSSRTDSTHTSDIRETGDDRPRARFSGGKSALVRSGTEWNPAAPTRRIAGLPVPALALAATIVLCVGAAVLLENGDRDAAATLEEAPRYLGGEDPSTSRNAVAGVTPMPATVDWSEIESTRPGPYRVRIRTSPAHHDDAGEIVYEMEHRQFPSLWVCPRTLRRALPETFLFQVLADDMNDDEEIVYQRLFSPPSSRE